MKMEYEELTKVRIKKLIKSMLAQEIKEAKYLFHQKFHREITDEELARYFA